MKQRTKFIMLILVVGIIIISFVFVMIGLIKSANECVGNPFIYANKLIVDSRGEYVYTVCSCEVGSIGSFYFDDKGLYEEHPLYPNPKLNEINMPNFTPYFEQIGRD